jgi:acetyltransferase-like isoleucine patch superfamily enzyme
LTLPVVQVESEFMRDRILRRWRRFWLHHAGKVGWGRVAARCAALGTAPYHGRAFLSYLDPRGFIAPTASVNHSALQMGKHVYLGDRVVVRQEAEGGPLELRDRVQIYGDAFIQTGAGAGIRIGEGTHIQPGCHLHAFVSDIEIGCNVEIAPNCAFYSYNHQTAPGITIMSQPLESKGPIKIGDGAWLGHGVIVLAGVTIGAGAVIGAGSVVLRDIPENAVAAGAPARVIKFRNEMLTPSTK